MKNSFGVRVSTVYGIYCCLGGVLAFCVPTQDQSHARASRRQTFITPYPKGFFGSSMTYHQHPYKRIRTSPAVSHRHRRSAGARRRHTEASHIATKRQPNRRSLVVRRPIPAEKKENAHASPFSRSRCSPTPSATVAPAAALRSTTRTVGASCSEVRHRQESIALSTSSLTVCLMIGWAATAVLQGRPENERKNGTGETECERLTERSLSCGKKGGSLNLRE